MVLTNTVKNILTILVISMSQFLQAQNLVPNPSFEDENICEQHQPCSPSAWFYVTKNLVAGYFVNEIPAATGKHWLSIVAGNRLNTGGRQYWETMLLHQLEKGATYKVRLSIHGWDLKPNPRDIGVYFIPELMFYKTDTVIQPDSYVDFADAKITEQKKGWFRLEKEFIAENASKVIMIGNFSHDNYQEVARKRTSKSIYAGLLVDDIEIVPVEKMDCKDCERVKDSLYSITTRHSSVDTIEPVKFAEITSNQESGDTLVLDDIYFAIGSSKISNLDSLEHYRSKFDPQTIKKIIVTGYTDDIGTVGANKILSLQRAKAVAGLIAEKFRIPVANIDTRGYGISRENQDKTKNRRVAVYIYRK